jgi:hypothetical protein
LNKNRSKKFFRILCSKSILVIFEGQTKENERENIVIEQKSDLYIKEKLIEYEKKIPNNSENELCII